MTTARLTLQVAKLRLLVLRYLAMRAAWRLVRRVLDWMERSG